MRFINFLNEKISKKEFDEVLDNPYLNAGCEFEFYLEEDFESSAGKENWNEMERLIDRSDNELNNIEKDLTEYWEAYRKKWKEFEKAENEIDKIEEIIDELIDKQLDLDEDDENYQQYYDTLENSINKRKDMIKDLRNIIEEWEDGVTEERLLERYEPVPSFNSLTYFSSIADELENMGMLTLDRNQIDNFNQWLWGQAMEQEEIPNTNQMLIELINMSIYDLEMAFREMGVEGVPSADDLYNEFHFPIKDVMNNDWEVKEDGSLGSNGVEISTGIYQLDELINIIEKVFKWIDKNGDTDSSCGFHVHLSIDGKAEVDALKLLLFTEEGKIYNEFEERIGNTYALAIDKGHFSKLDPFTKENLMKLAKKEKLDKKLSLDKYMGVHLIDLGNNHVEFRYMGGTNYHRKFKEVREIITNYGYWLSIAADPNFKRKEYLQKAARLNNKYSYTYYSNVIDYYWEYVNDYFKDKNLPSTKITGKFIKPYIDKIKAIPKPKKLLKIPDRLRIVAKKVAAKEFEYFLKYYKK